VAGDKTMIQFGDPCPHCGSPEVAFDHECDFVGGVCYRCKTKVAFDYDTAAISDVTEFVDRAFSENDRYTEFGLAERIDGALVVPASVFFQPMKVRITIEVLHDGHLVL
jgi:hypothetical protein